MWSIYQPVSLISSTILAYCYSQTAECSSAALLGINLGRTHLTAAIFNESGPVALGRQAGSQSYQDFMAASLDDDQVSTLDSEQTQSMLQKELESIRNLARELANDDLHIGAISYPRHFYYQKPRDIVWQAAIMLDPDFFDSVGRMRSEYAATVQTYPLSGCLDITVNDSPPDATSDMVLMFDYSFQKLHVDLLYVDKSVVGLDFDGTLVSPKTRTALHEVLLEPLRLVGESEIATVILSSEDSDYDYAELEQTLGEDFPILGSKLQTRSTGLEYVHAVGAACRAKQLAAFPLPLDGTDSCTLFDAHDEL